MNELLASHPLLTALGWTLIHFVWQACVVGLMCAIGSRYCARQTTTALCCIEYRYASSRVLAATDLRPTLASESSGHWHAVSFLVRDG